MQGNRPINHAVRASHVARIIARQATLGITDSDLCQAVGFDREVILTLIKAGSMQLPLTKIPAFAEALRLDAGQLLREALEGTVPDLLKVIETVFNPLPATASTV